MNVVFTYDVYKRMFAYVDAVNSEISGFGKIKKIGNFFYITDIKIFQQEVTASETILSKKSLGAFFDELVVKGENLSDWRLWWHSHANMSTFFSTTDNETIEDFDLETEKDNWMLSVVVNKAKDVLCRLDLYAPIRFTVNDIAWNIDTFDPELSALIGEEVKEKVTKKPVTRKSLSLRRPDPTLLHLLYPDLYDEDGNQIIEGVCL